MKWGLIAAILFGVVWVGVYLLKAKKAGYAPETNDVIGVFLAADGVLAGLKLLGFVVSGDLDTAVAQVNPNGHWLRISSGDWVFFTAGALALIWVSAVGIYRTICDVGAAEETQKEG